MRLRDVKGKRITGIDQVRFYNKHLRRFEVELLHIYLDDGSAISFYAAETIEQPCVTAIYTSAKERQL